MKQYANYPIGRYHVSLIITEDGDVQWRLEFDGQRVAGGVEPANLVIFKVLRMMQAHASGHLLPKAEAVTA